MQGDVLDDGVVLWLVLQVAEGPGVGQYRLEVCSLGRLYRWQELGRYY